MEYYLLQLSYSTSGWREIVAENAGFDRRLDKVRNLIAELGGSFANFHFFDRDPFKSVQPPPVVQDKFIMFGCTDLIAVLAMPSKQQAQAFTTTLRCFPHIQEVRLTSLMPFEEAMNQSVPTAKGIVDASKFSGPSSPAPAQSR